MNISNKYLVKIILNYISSSLNYEKELLNKTISIATNLNLNYYYENSLKDIKRNEMIYHIKIIISKVKRYDREDIYWTTKFVM